LITPRFATAGDNADFREVLKYVRMCKPNVRMFGLAFSAGTATLYRYIGEAGDDSVLDGACCVSSGYDTDFCIENVPAFMGGLILRKMKEFWLHPNEQILRERNSEGYDILSKATNVWDFHKEVYRFNQPHNVQSNGSRASQDDELVEESESRDIKRKRVDSTGECSISQSEWLKDLNPILTSEGSRRPVLFIHALDDPIFTRYILEHAKPMILQNPYNLLVEMKTGFHVCFFENFFHPTRWTDRVALEFFDTLLMTSMRGS